MIPGAHKPVLIQPASKSTTNRGVFARAFPPEFKSSSKLRKIKYCGYERLRKSIRVLVTLARGDCNGRSIVLYRCLFDSSGL